MDIILALQALVSTIIICILFYYRIKSLILEIKWAFKPQNLQIFGLKSNKCELIFIHFKFRVAAGKLQLQVAEHTYSLTMKSIIKTTSKNNNFKWIGKKIMKTNKVMFKN